MSQYGGYSAMDIEHNWGENTQASAITDGDVVLLKATQVLATQFHDALIVRENSQEFSNTTEKCAFFADQLRKEVVKTLNPEGAQPIFASVVRQLTNEQNAYELMKITQEYAEQSERTDNYLSDLLKENDDFRMFTILLEWTERSGQRITEGFSKAVFDKVQGFRSLRDETSKMISRGRKNEDGKDIGVSPDEQPCRSDLSNVQVFYRTLFSYIRCGWLEEAEQLCDEFGDCTLSSLFELRLVNRNGDYTPHEVTDPNYTMFEKRMFFKDFVNRNWEEMQSQKWPMHKYNIYGAIAGRLQPLIDVAVNTEDRIWCYANSAVEMMLDAFRKCRREGLEQGIPNTIDELCEQINLKHESSPYMHIYFYLLKNQINECVKFMSEWVDENRDRAGEHVLRFMAHLVVIWRTENTEHDINLGIRVITHYALRLANIGLHTLLPFYFSFLMDHNERNRRIMEAMNNVPQEQDRITFLNNAALAGINVSEIVQLYVNDFLQELRGREVLVTADFDVAVNRFTWLLYRGEETLSEAIIETNSLLRLCLKLDKEDFAREVLARSQTDQGNMADRAEKLSKKDAFLHRAIEEHRSHLCYMAGMDKWLEYSDAREKAHRLEIAQNEANSAQKDSLLGITGQELAKKRQSIKLEHTNARLETMKQEAEKMYISFLLHSGWRTGKPIKCPSLLLEHQEDVRTKELSQLRAMYYSSVSFMLVGACEMRNDSERAMELARMLADDKLGLYQDIERNILQTLLKKLQNVAADSLYNESQI